MEFFQNNWILFRIIIIFITVIKICNGLQGIPTWLCLGIKSPFIEFQAEIEILSNNSVSLNVTKDDYSLMHYEGLDKLADFIKPIDLRNSSTGYVKSNLTKKLPSTLSPPLGRRKMYPNNPIAEEMDKKEIEILEDDSDTNMNFPNINNNNNNNNNSNNNNKINNNNNYNNNDNNKNNDDRKYIVPMALRNPTREPKKSSQSQSDFSTNIDDLKNHILMLQNLTKNDRNFQSKFVVFPSLQREKNNNTKIPQTKIQSSSSSLFTTTAFPKLFREQHISNGGSGTLKITSENKNYGAFGNNNNNNNNNDNDHEDIFSKDKITIIPQVLLLNDQTPPDDNDNENERKHNNNQNRKDTRISSSTRRRNFRKYSTTTKIMTTTTIRPFRRNQKLQKQLLGDVKGDHRKVNRRQQNCRNLDTPRCRRQRRKQQQQQHQQQSQLSSIINNGTNVNHHDLFEENSSKIHLIKNDSMIDHRQNDNQKLSRSIRSHYIRGNMGRSMRSSSLQEISLPTRDFIIPFGGNINNNQTIAYKENVNLNPHLCYKVDGMTYGQQKLCFLHSSIMPAVSRGARAAIQECQHQFKNRRWNCSTTDDNTVFGPMTSIGSPEMAFIHALAAATVTSFIARACRDGQLPQCGCSRSSRPKQLHDDWTWGGCGDDLEFAYKISQDFIDIREKERKREARELISALQKGKSEEKLFSSSSSLSMAGVGYSDSGSGISLNSNSSHNSNTSSIVGTVTAISTTPHNFQDNNNNKTFEKEDDFPSFFNPEDLLELQEKITKEILNSKLQEKEMIELQEKINREILNSKVFNMEHHGIYGNKRQRQKPELGIASSSSSASSVRVKNGLSAKARSLMNLHNNEAGRRAVIKKTRITCKCHGVSGSCSLITCWQQLSSIREIGDYLRERYDEATEVKLNKRGRLQVKDPQYKVPTAHDLVYLDESPDWCRNSKQLQWPGTHGRVCNKTSSGLDGCAILCCGRGYNTKNIIVRERCNCKFHWCCQVKCEICVKVLEEYTCK